MKLKLKRQVKTSKSTIGSLEVDGVFHCYTLEDVVRMAKIPGESAIPCGKYNVLIDFSSKFKKQMLHVLDVPGFDGIRIHSGNWAKDTDGCILVGFIKEKDYIGRSRDALESVFNLVQNALNNGEKVELEVVEEPEGV